MADKGMAMVVLDGHDYIQKVENLLEQKNTYRTISVDPSNTQKNKLINLLKCMKAEGV